MKKLFVSLLAGLVLTQASYASGKVPVMVIDSGSDFEHTLLKPVADPNLAELNGTKGTDDDSNGYTDDVYGWNFTDDSPVLVNYEYTPPRYDDVMKFMEIMGKLQDTGINSLTPDELDFARKNYNDQNFMSWVQFTGGWSHGTHVAGIMANGNDAVDMKAISHIPVGEAPEKEVAKALSYINFMRTRYRSRGEEESSIMDQLKAYFVNMGKEAAAAIEPEAKYIGSLNPRVINCSFGTDNPQLLKVFKQNMEQSWGMPNPTPEQVQELVNLFVKYAQLPKDKVFFKYVPNALIVIAAGNSSEDNDGIVVSPNNCEIDNKLVVAATNQDKSLAEFSCFGKTTVDVAVPGVNILSSYPNGKMGRMSGTSQAAPCAAKYASMVLAANQDLSAVEVKQILMETVDKKAWLKDKVVSGGVINVERAVSAAKAMKERGLTIADAIAAANEELPQIPAERGLAIPKIFVSDEEKAMYFSTVF